MVILKLYGEKIKLLPASALKQELQYFVDGLIQDKAQKRKTFNLNDPKEELDEIALSLSSHDKIFFNPLLLEKELNNFRKKHSDPESHNVSSFLSPRPSDKLKHLPTIINLEEGCYYDINIILFPFLRESKNIRIEDPYLPNEKASSNLWKIFDHLNNANLHNARIKLVFYELSKYASGDQANERRYNTFIRKLNDYQNKGMLIDYSEPFIKKSHRERWIFTQEFQIYLPGGLDFLNDEGFFIHDLKPYTHDVDFKSQIKIENRGFKVTFD